MRTADAIGSRGQVGPAYPQPVPPPASVEVVVSSSTPDRSVVVPATTHRRRAIVLAALALFQLWMWGTRLWNIAQEAGDFSAAFVGVHVVLFVTGIAAGLVLGVLAWQQWREARQATVSPARADVHDR